MEPLIGVIMLWLSASFALPAVPDHPQVKHISPQQLAAIRFGEAATQRRDHDVLGAYDDGKRTIFLRDDWDSRKAADVSVLVHEIVHYLEHRASVSHACLGEREALAYQAQQRWLQLFGESLESAFGLDAMTLKIRTNCLPH